MRPIAVLPAVIAALIVCLAQAEEPVDNTATAAGPRSLSGEEIRHLPAMYDDPIGAVRTLPGVMPDTQLQYGLNYRSQPGDRLGLQVDGWSLPIISHWDRTSTLNPMLVDRIELSNEIPSARYGGFSSGLIQAQLRPLVSSTAAGSFSLNVARASALITMPIGERGEFGTLTAAGRVSYADKSLTTWLSSNPSTAGASFRPSDFFIGYGTTRGRHDVELTAFNLIDASGSPGAKSATGAWQIRLKWHARLPDGWQLLLQPMWSTRTFTNTRTAVTQGTPTQFYDEISAQAGGLRAAASKQLLPQLHGEAGVEIMQSWMTESIPSGQPYQFSAWSMPDPKPIARQAAYAELRFKWGRVESIGGLRAERFQLTDGPRLSLVPRISIQADLSNALQLKGGWGIFHQPNAPDAMSGGETIDPRTPGVEQTSQFFAGARQKFGARTLLDVQGFFSWRTHLQAEFIPDRLSWDSRGRTYGLEIILRRTWGALVSGWIGYTFSRSTFWAAEVARELRTNLDRTHQVTAVGCFSVGGGFRFSARYAGSAGQYGYSLGLSIFPDSQQVTILAFNEGRSDTWTHRLDLRLEKAVTFSAWQLTAYLDVASIAGDKASPGLPSYLQTDSTKLFGMKVAPVVGLNADF